MSCFGKRKAKKSHREPPPSLNELDNRAVDQYREERQYSVEFSGRSSAPPLPQRQLNENTNETRRTTDNKHSANGSPPSQKGPVSNTDQSDGSLGNNHSTRDNNVTAARPLSSDILCTPVPVGGHSSSTTKPAKSGYKSLERVASGNYLDPNIEAPVSPPPSERAPTPTPNEARTASKQKASISEEKRSDILNDYFQAERMTGLNIAVPLTPSHNNGQTEHDYTNLNQLEYPDTFNLPGALKSESKLHGSADLNLKSPRRPRPVPRVHTGSEKSVSSDCDDTEFPYENVQETLRRLSDTTTASDSGSRSTTPRPQPRPRTDNKLSHDNSRSLAKPVLAALSPEINFNSDKLSPLQQRSLAKPGYVYDVDYVPPNAALEAQFNSKQSPTGLRKTLPKPTNVQHSANLPSDGSVNLSAPIPKAGSDHGIISQARKGYLPMDQSPLTQAATNNGSNYHSSSADKTAQLLNRKIPVPTGNINDFHVPGYITVLSGAAPPVTKKMGEYYNLNNRQDYLNIHTTPPSKVHDSSGNAAESNYFG